MIARASLVAAAALLFAPGASAGRVYAKVLSPTGKVIATGEGAGFDYPADGSLVHVGAAAVTPLSVTLTDVSLYGGVFQATQLYLPARRSEAITGTIAAAGRLLEPTPNALVSLGVGAYVVVDQRARSKGLVGRVGLRLVLGRAALGSQPGTQVLLGLPPRLRVRRTRASTSTPGQPDSLAALGFAAADARLVGYDPTPVASSTPGERAVVIAEQFLGVPYVWGGADPLTGFDCSGLTMYVYAQLGVQLTYYTGAQFTEGARLPRGELRPGDLVFFDNDLIRGPQHEGIYIGAGRFIQAPHTGDVVKISTLDDPRYGFGYVGAVRPSR